MAVYDDEEEVFKSISRCMTFTDEMYNATREYYFNGKPYPSHVGIGGNVCNGSPEETNDASGDDNNFLDEEVENESDDECVSVGGSNEFEVDVGIEGYDTESRVNCFPSRPSNTLIVTNESPPIWFQPSEGECSVIHRVKLIRSI